MVMLCLMFDKIIWYNIQNENIWESVGVTPTIENMMENKLRWFKFVERRSVDCIVRIVDQMESSKITRERNT